MLTSTFTVLMVSTLVPDNQDAKLDACVPVDDRVGKVCEGIRSAPLVRRCSKAWMILEQTRDSFELSEETPSQSDSCLSLVEPSGLCKVFRGEPVDGPIH